MRQLLLVGDLVEQYAEFLPAPARRHVARARCVLQPSRDLAQHPVATLMAVRVVDALEVVDVDHGERGSGSGAGEARAQHFREVPAVEQLGQRIDARQPLQAQHGLGALFLGAPHLRDVAGGSREQHAPVVEHPHRRAIADPAHHAVDAHEAVLLLHDVAVPSGQVGEAPGHVIARAILRVHELVVVVEHLLRLLPRAEQRGQTGTASLDDEALVGVQLTAVEVLADHTRRDGERLPRRLRLCRQRRPHGDVAAAQHYDQTVHGAAQHCEAGGGRQQESDRDGHPPVHRRPG